MKHMHFCYCKECDDFKGIVDTRIGQDGTKRVAMDCGHKRYFKLEEIEK